MRTATNSKGSLTVISGFSGAGKGTIMKALLKKYSCYQLSVSVTTRKPRPGEVDGKDYFFLTQEEFQRKVDNDELLEHAGYVDHCYGTPRAFVDRKIAEGKDVLLEIEVQGAAIVKKKRPDTILLFVTPPSAQVLRERLTGRGTESPEVVKERLEQAAREVKQIGDYDALIVNDDLDRAVETVHQTIQMIKNTPARQREFIGSLKQQLDDLNRELENS